MLRPYTFYLFLSILACRSANGFLPLATTKPRQSPRLYASTTIAKDGLSIGFVGCGTIAAAIATGLATQTEHSIQSIAVTERSKTKSSKLKEQFPDLVTVHADSQEILNQADLIFVCVLPAQVSTVLQQLSFDRDRHTLVSLVSTANLQSLATDSSLDPSRVWKMICLPSVARQQGACLVCPAPPTSPQSSNEPPLYQLFESIGGCIPCPTQELLEAAMLSTCVMGPLYGVMRQNRNWLIDKGLDADDADKLITQQYLGAVAHASNSGIGLDALVEEQTPGGLNEQALTILEENGVLKVYDQAMESVYKRIRGD